MSIESADLHYEYVGVDSYLPVRRYVDVANMEIEPTGGLYTVSSDGHYAGLIDREVLGRYLPW